MSRTRFQAKQNGRRILEGKWLQAIFITLLVFLLESGVSLMEGTVRDASGVPETIGTGLLAPPNLSVASLSISAVFLIITFLILSPLHTGQAEWYWQLAGRKENSVGNVFGWLGSLRLCGRSLALSLALLWRMLLWALLVYAAPAALLLIYQFALGGANTLAANIVLVLFVLLTVGATVVLVFLYTRYFPARYLLVEDPSRRPEECVRAAVRYTKGFRVEIFLFELSFVLWMLLCEFILPIFYVFPYYNASCAVLAQHIIFSRRAQERRDTAPVKSADRPDPKDHLDPEDRSGPEGHSGSEDHPGPGDHSAPEDHSGPENGPGQP